MSVIAPNLIFGAAYNLKVPQVRVFVESLRRYYHGQVMLLVTSVDSEELVAYLRSMNVTPVFFDCPHWMVTNIQVARYVRYAETLRTSGDLYGRILLSDVTDVLFQADPFDTLPDGELLCFLETPGRTIGQCTTNTGCVQQIYGPAGVEKIKDFDISCSGTTIGTQPAILHYIDLLLDHAEPVLLAKVMESRGHDQGIHNFLLRTGQLPSARLIPNGQHVFTLGYTPDREIISGPNGAILTATGRRCPIVHQYNYKRALVPHVESAFRI